MPLLGRSIVDGKCHSLGTCKVSVCEQTFFVEKAVRYLLGKIWSTKENVIIELVELFQNEKLLLQGLGYTPPRTDTCFFGMVFVRKMSDLFTIAWK